ENSQIKIRLKPDSLGTLDVSLNMEGGKLTARLLASSAEVRDVFAANLQQFKQSLEARGMQVTQLSVAVRAETGTQGQAGQRQPQPQAGPPLVVPSIPNLSAAESAFSGLVGADVNAQRFSALA
ncbi:MAG: flagellar hook-length control protein FliK, partial [candidate division FCPU426 bacterium]